MPPSWINGKYGSANYIPFGNAKIVVLTCLGADRKANDAIKKTAATNDFLLRFVEQLTGVLFD